MQRNTKNKNTLHPLKGLSLVEVLVVLGLFSGIATIALGTLFNTQAINARLQQSQSILDNVNLSFETVVRDLRYGSEFFCTNSPATTTPVLRKGCPKSSGGGTVIFFKPPYAANAKDRVVYYVSNGILYKVDLPFGLASTTYQMTSTDVSISTSSFRFFVDGAQSSDGSRDVGSLIDYRQPIVTLFVSGVARPFTSKEAPLPFHIETSVSSRVPDSI